MDLLLKGKRALITGGMSNLGVAICTTLAKEGVDVLFTYSSKEGEDKAHQFAQSLHDSYGVTSQSIHLDLKRCKACFYYNRECSLQYISRYSYQ